jgi:chromosome segregation ATPase
LKIAADEKSEANEEIERLQIEMRGHSRKLEEAQLLLSQKEGQVNELESQNAELKEHDNGTTSQNAKLTEEVDELRKELSNSNTKISDLGEKCKTFKKKINEVLTEQQTLYGQVESSFHAAVTELRQEKAKRETDVKEIDSALDLCEKKREQMKREFDDIHARDQNEIHQSR